MTDLLPEQIEASKRQCDNMAFILNHVPMPEQYYAKFTDELKADRAAIEAYEATRTPPDDGLKKGELRPCPFCGGDVELIHDVTTENIDRIRHVIPQINCPINGASGFDSGNDALVVNWNTRAAIIKDALQANFNREERKEDHD